MNDLRRVPRKPHYIFRSTTLAGTVADFKRCLLLKRDATVAPRAPTSTEYFYTKRRKTVMLHRALSYYIIFLLNKEMRSSDVFLLWI